MEKKVSIIIPAYNVEEYIYRAIESSINQTYNNVEIIIIDDGSSDKTWNVICEYRKKDKRIIAKKQKNQGVSSARNNGLSIASGEFVIFIDSDDWIDKNCIRKLLNNMNKNESSVLISSDCKYAITNGMNIETFSSKKNYKAENRLMSYEESLICFCKSQYRLSSACYKLFDMKLIRKNNLHFEEKISYGEDGLFVYNYLKHCKGIFYYDELWYILDRPGSATTSKYNSKWLSAITSAEMIINDNDNHKLDKYYKLYACGRISSILSGAIKSNEKENIKDIFFLKKKMRKYITGIFAERKIKKIVYFLLLAYFPTSLLHWILLKK